MAALGAEVVDFPLRTACCGGHMTQIGPNTGFELIRRLVDAADRREADLMVTVCPMCQMNVDAYQGEMNHHFRTAYHMPILFFTQLIGLAFGLEPKALGIGTEIVSARARARPDRDRGAAARRGARAGRAGRPRGTPAASDRRVCRCRGSRGRPMSGDRPSPRQRPSPSPPVDRQSEDPSRGSASTSATAGPTSPASSTSPRSATGRPSGSVRTASWSPATTRSCARASARS